MVYVKHLFVELRKINGNITSMMEQRVYFMEKEKL